MNRVKEREIGTEITTIRLDQYTHDLKHTTSKHINAKIHMKLLFISISFSSCSRSVNNALYAFLSCSRSHFRAPISDTHTHSCSLSFTLSLYLLRLPLPFAFPRALSLFVMVGSVIIVVTKTAATLSAVCTHHTLYCV